MGRPEITHHSRFPQARCDAVDVIDESGQLNFRLATEFVGHTNDGRYR
jgi:hypothetical protein